MGSGALLRAGDPRGPTGGDADNRCRLPCRPALVSRGSSVVSFSPVFLGGAQYLLPGRAPHGVARDLRAVEAAQDDEARVADYVQAVAGRDEHLVVAGGHSPLLDTGNTPPDTSSERSRQVTL